MRSIDVAAHAGTAFDGEHLFQIAEDRIQKIDPKTGRVLATIPAPGGGGDSGLTWAEGTLWVGQYRDRKIHQIDPQTGAILRTIESNRFVTGVTWVDGMTPMMEARAVKNQDEHECMRIVGACEVALEKMCTRLLSRVAFGKGNELASDFAREHGLTIDRMRAQYGQQGLWGLVRRLGRSAALAGARGITRRGCRGRRRGRW